MLNVLFLAWTYDNVAGPKYEAAPRLPKWTRRVEAVFVSDAAYASSSDLAEAEAKGHIEVSPLNKGDYEIERRVVREVSRKRGRFEGSEGWWLDREFEILAVPERKTLFVFGGEGKGGR